MDFGFTKNIIINYYFFISRNKKLLLLFSWNYKYDKSAIFSEADILLHYSLKNFLDIWVTYLLSSKKTIIYKEYNRWHEYYFSFSRFCLLPTPRKNHAEPDSDSGQGASCTSSSTTIGPPSPKCILSRVSIVFYWFSNDYHDRHNNKKSAFETSNILLHAMKNYVR